MFDPTDQPKDTTRFTPNDWAALGKLRQAYRDKGRKGLEDALQQLHDTDFLSYFRVIESYFPDQMLEALKDEAAGLGIDQDDIDEVKRRVQEAGDPFKLPANVLMLSRLGRR